MTGQKHKNFVGALLDPIFLLGSKNFTPVK